MTSDTPLSQVGQRGPLDRIAPAAARNALANLLCANQDGLLTAWRAQTETFLFGAALPVHADVTPFAFRACLDLLRRGAVPSPDGLLDRIARSGEAPVDAASRLHHVVCCLPIVASPLVDSSYHDEVAKHQAMALLMGVVDVGVGVICRALEKAVNHHAHQMEERHLRFLEDVTRVLTRDCLRLVPAVDVPAPKGERLGIREPLDCSRLRRAVAVASHEIGMDQIRAEDLGLAVGEAVSNVLKHAGEGHAHVWRDDHTVFVRVDDCGKGISTENIPKALSPGWSSDVSLGMGFTLMLEMADALWLATGELGTTICIEKSRHAQRPPIPNAFLGR